MININCGVLGHVDSGKTTLSRALSQIGSTASFDKNPQSKERGITLDLGFSSFIHKEKRYTLVDCPGHGSLIKTVIGGASIIDMMMLVIDVNKGVQAQTVECLVLGSIIDVDVVFILNKIDQIPADQREKKLAQMTKQIETKIIPNFKFKSTKVVTASALEQDLDRVLAAFDTLNAEPNRDELEKREFLMAIDHCFQIKGSGTVFTGTVLSGQIALNDQVEVVSFSETKKVKSIQIFRQGQKQAKAGDRAAICVTQFDAAKVERGLLSTPNALKPVMHVVIRLNRVKLFRETIKSHSKFNITIGHQTCTAILSLFKPMEGDDVLIDENLTKAKFTHVDEMDSDSMLAVLEFDRSMYSLPSGLLIGSRLDLDASSAKNCRIAFCAKMTSHSHLIDPIDLIVLKKKQKLGKIERVHDEQTLIVKDLFKKETNVDFFERLKVTLSNGEAGFINGTFGTSGKIKIVNSSGFSESLRHQYRKLKKGEKREESDPITVQLDFFKNVRAKNKNQIIQ